MIKRSEKTRTFKQTHARDYCFYIRELSAEKPAAIIDFRALHNLGTKVLADKLTIDEILR